MDLLYFDNAATSWPKPEETQSAMNRYLREIGGSPGRSGHRLSIEAGRIVLEAREAVAQLFGVDDPFRIVFTKNATEALNIAFRGLLNAGDHVITSSMEHNSVMRPLRTLEGEGVEVSVLPCSVRGELDPETIPPAIRPNTKAIILTHASNVTGTILPIGEAGRVAREHGLVLIVDAAQTAGILPIAVEAMGIDLLAFTGHKSLFGPPGTGGLYIREGMEARIRPLMTGGTGSRSEFEEQPLFLPDKFEAGTPNTIGLAAWLPASPGSWPAASNRSAPARRPWRGGSCAVFGKSPGSICTARPIRRSVSPSSRSTSRAFRRRRRPRNWTSGFLSCPARSPLRPRRPPDDRDLPPGNRPVRVRSVQQGGGDRRRPGSGPLTGPREIEAQCAQAA